MEYKDMNYKNIEGTIMHDIWETSARAIRRSENLKDDIRHGILKPKPRRKLVDTGLSSFP